MKLQLILDFLSPTESIVTKSDIEISFKSIEDAGFDANSIGWCSDKNLGLLSSIKCGTIILSKKGNEFCKLNSLIGFNQIIVDHPRKVFASILNNFFIKEETFSFISPSAYISDSVHFDFNEVNISHNVVIEDDVVLGNKVIIGANTVIKSGTIIKDNVKIGSNCTVGGVGFGYEPNEEGNFELIPHIGNVILEDNVEIGNNFCIDRAVLGSTRLSKNVKVDNLVHIAHGVQIGQNSLIIANSMIAGSVKIGQNVWVSPSSSIIQKVKIEDDSIIGMGSVVLKNVNKGEVVAGVPSKLIRKK